MNRSKKLILAAWLMTLVFIVCAFLPLLQFSFNDYSVNLFGICGEFASRDRAGFRHYAPLGYTVFAIITLTALTQVFSLISAVKKSVKGTRKLSFVMTIVSIAILAGYLLLVNVRSSYTLTAVSFIFAAAGIAYIILSGKAAKAQAAE